MPPSTSAVAPGKIILAGEHAVVYGRPAIAIPVWKTTARAEVTDATAHSGCTIVAHDINETIPLQDAADTNPLALVVRRSLAKIGLPPNPNWRIDLRSDIPIASGLGSGAAVSTALTRAVFQHTGEDADPAVICELVYESERLFHGTPSGLDNAVIAYGQPLWYVKGEAPAFFTPEGHMVLAIADTGLSSPTKETVSDVRQAWEREPAWYEAIFDQIGEIALQTRQALKHGNQRAIGQLFNQNQTLLRALGVSSPELETLIKVALDAGASGAKLSGGGRGGNMIALVEPGDATAISSALMDAGAKRVLITTVTRDKE